MRCTKKKMDIEPDLVVCVSECVCVVCRCVCPSCARVHRRLKIIRLLRLCVCLSRRDGNCLQEKGGAGGGGGGAPVLDTA